MIIRDSDGNGIGICTWKASDPMGIHTERVSSLHLRKLLVIKNIIPAHHALQLATIYIIGDVTFNSQ